MSMKTTRRLTPLRRASTEIGSIVFLFYSNLLMGEFTASRQKEMTLASAMSEIVTLKNFGIAMVSAVIGYLVFDSLRARHR